MEGPFEIDQGMHKIFKKELIAHNITSYMTFQSESLMAYAIFMAFSYKMLVTNPYLLGRCLESLINKVPLDEMNRAVFYMKRYCQSYDVSEIEEYINGESIDKIKSISDILNKYVKLSHIGDITEGDMIDSLSQLMRVNILIYDKNSQILNNVTAYDYTLCFINMPDEHIILFTKEECNLYKGERLPSFPIKIEQNDQEEGIKRPIIPEEVKKKSERPSIIEEDKNDSKHSSISEEYKKIRIAGNISENLIDSGNISSKDSMVGNLEKVYLFTSGRESKIQNEVKKEMPIIKQVSAIKEESHINLEYSVLEFNETTLMEETFTVVSSST